MNALVHQAGAKIYDHYSDLVKAQAYFKVDKTTPLTKAAVEKVVREKNFKLREMKTFDGTWEELKAKGS